MYNKKNTHPIRRNEIKTLKVFLKGKTFKVTYSLDALKDILNSNIFDKIQIPVYMHNATLFGDGKKGLSVVGNVISYNDETGEMTLSIFSRFTTKVNAIEDAIVFPRVIAIREKGEEVAEDEVAEDIRILGFDIASEDFYKSLDD